MFLVGGWQRTGTSMMMKCLHHGGLDAVHRKNRSEAVLKTYSDDKYNPNEGGLYELSRQDYNNPNFPRGYEGKLLKMLQNSPIKMRVMDKGIRVVYMRRHAEEVRQSFQAFFPEAQDGYGVLRHFRPDRKPEENWKAFQDYNDSIVEALRNRKDVISVHEFWYKDVVADPQKHFDQLKEAGWEINVGDACGVVEERLRRFRLEKLTVGL